MSQGVRRNRPGTKAFDLWAWGQEDISQMAGPFAVQEYLQELIRADPSNVKRICEVPNGVDEYVWQYEHLRQFIIELNLLVVQLLGHCTRETCPKMLGNITQGVQFMCAAHKQPQECSAMDYMIHSLDHSTAIIQNTNNFSSRVSIPQSSAKHLNNIVRRLYRLFAHTYWHHDVIFKEFENEMHLCARFTQLARQFKMMSNDLFIIPEEAIQI